MISAVVPAHGRDVATVTIDVLTAEVRVLMVGNRQITLSVFRQLDAVKQDDCEPMGRINDSTTGRQLMIGRHRTTGVLVRASFDRENPRFTFEEQRRYDQLKIRSRNEMSSADVRELAEMHAITAEMPRLMEAFRAAVAAYEALPLIVLAGLR